MGNGYNHRLHKQSQHLHHKYTFLPMLCSRPSIKDVCTPGQSTSVSNDPLSPKISCMGQVKRNNKIVGFPSSTNKLAITTKNSHGVRYSKLKKMFSGNSLSGTTSSTTNTATTICRRREVPLELDGASRPKIDESKVASVLISIDEMDPPLPVIKKVRKPEDEEEGNNLWKRRSGGATLRNLQLQQIQTNRYNVPPSTV